jgi:CheY-like chemotaxis protein
MTVRVLVVDDTDHVRAMLVEMLRLDGFDVVAHCGEGAEAVAQATATDPDVVVLDLRMPDMDGLDTARQIRELRPHQPIVLYTAYLDGRVEADAHAAGIDVCLAKVEGIEHLERELSRLALATD